MYHQQETNRIITDQIIIRKIDRTIDRIIRQKRIGQQHRDFHIIGIDRVTIQLVQRIERHLYRLRVQGIEHRTRRIYPINVIRVTMQSASLGENCSYSREK